MPWPIQIFFLLFIPFLSNAQTIYPNEDIDKMEMKFKQEALDSQMARDGREYVKMREVSDEYTKRALENLEMERRTKELEFSNLKIPTAIPLDYSTPKPVKTVDQIIEDTYTEYEKNPQQAREVFAPTVSVQKDENGNYPQDKYAHGALGYDLTKSLDGNEQMYKEAGYTMSYSIKDSTIFGIIIGVIISIILLILGMSVKENNKNKFTAEN